MTTDVDFNLFHNEEYLSCVFYNEANGKWRVRSTGGATAGISFGHYATRKEATEIGKRVKALKTKSQAYRLRKELGINGRGAYARAQRQVIKRDNSRSSINANNELVSLTIKLPKSEIYKLISS